MKEVITDGKRKIVCFNERQASKDVADSQSILESLEEKIASSPVILHVFGGASVLVGNDIQRIRSEYYQAIQGERKPFIPELWDGQTAERCLRLL